MTPLSIENAYLWSQRFVMREWRLILPVILAFLVLPPLVPDLLLPQSARALVMAAMETKNPALAMDVLRWLAPVQLAILIIGAAGALAITALALLPNISVREAIVIALRRLGVLIVTVLLIMVVEIAAIVGAAILLAFAGLTAQGVQSLIIGLLIGFSLFVGVRLVPLVPMIVRRRVGPIAALRESWMMTAGAFWRICGAVIIYLLGAVIVAMALSTGVGAMLLLLGKAIGLPELGTILNAVFARVVTAFMGAGFHLLAAAMFRQLDGSSRGI